MAAPPEEAFEEIHDGLYAFAMETHETKVFSFTLWLREQATRQLWFLRIADEQDSTNDVVGKQQLAVCELQTLLREALRSSAEENLSLIDANSSSSSSCSSTCCFSAIDSELGDDKIVSLTRANPWCSVLKGQQMDGTPEESISQSFPSLLLQFCYFTKDPICRLYRVFVLSPMIPVTNRNWRMDKSQDETEHQDEDDNRQLQSSPTRQVTELQKRVTRLEQFVDSILHERHQLQRIVLTVEDFVGDHLYWQKGLLGKNDWSCLVNKASLPSDKLYVQPGDYHVNVEVVVEPSCQEDVSAVELYVNQTCYDSCPLLINMGVNEDVNQRGDSRAMSNHSLGSEAFGASGRSLQSLLDDEWTEDTSSSSLCSLRPVRLQLQTYVAVNSSRHDFLRVRLLSVTRVLAARCVLVRLRQGQEPKARATGSHDRVPAGVKQCNNMSSKPVEGMVFKCSGPETMVDSPSSLSWRVNAGAGSSRKAPEKKWAKDRVEFGEMMNDGLRPCSRLSTCTLSGCRNIHVQPQFLCRHRVDDVGNCTSDHCNLVRIKPCRYGATCRRQSFGQCGFSHPNT